MEPEPKNDDSRKKRKQRKIEFDMFVRDLEPEEDGKIRGGGRETGGQKKLDDDQNSKRP